MSVIFFSLQNVAEIIEKKNKICKLIFLFLFVCLNLSEGSKIRIFWQ